MWRWLVMLSRWTRWPVAAVSAAALLAACGLLPAAAPKPLAPAAASAQTATPSPPPCYAHRNCVGTARNFYDYQPGQWWNTYERLAFNLGIVAGYPDRTFRPDAPVTRGEAAAMLYGVISRAAPPVSQSALQAFQQAEGTAWEDNWSAPDVKALVEYGVIKAGDYPGGGFDPNGNISRGTMAAWVVRSWQLLGGPPASLSGINPMGVVWWEDFEVREWSTNPAYDSPYQRELLKEYHSPLNFPDPTEVLAHPHPAKFDPVSLPTAPLSVSFSDVAGSTPHEASILTAARYGLVAGMGGGMFDPAGTLTRAQAATMIVKALNELPAQDPQAELAALKTVTQGAITQRDEAAAAATANGTINSTTVAYNEFYSAMHPYATAYLVWANMRGIEPGPMPVNMIVADVQPVFLGSRVADTVQTWEMTVPASQGGSTENPVQVTFVRTADGWKVSGYRLLNVSVQLPNGQVAGTCRNTVC